MPEQQRDELMNEVISRLARIETKLDAHTPQLNDHETRIRELESKSGKRWESLTLAAITAVVVGVIGFAIGKLFG